VAAGQEVHCFEGHRLQVNSVTFSPDGRRVLSGSSDHPVRLWEVPEDPALEAISLYDKLEYVILPLFMGGRSPTLR